MDAPKNKMDDAFVNNLDFDIENTRKTIEHKLTLFGALDGMHKNKYAYHPVKNFIGANKNCVFLYDQESRNGLTPRTAYTQSLKEKNMLIEDRRKVGDDIDRENYNNFMNENTKIVAPCYYCDFCGASFTIRSLLGAHKRSHDAEFQARFYPKRQSSNSNLLVNGYQCRFCDRKFDLERTLHIHQMCHCKKISPAERRGLTFTVLEHEKKPPLPELFHKAPLTNIK